MEHEYFLVIPPYFDGNNNAYWKVRMKVFLKSIDERVWNSIEYGWEKPATPVSEWQTSQKEVAVFNSKAMNAIFNAVSMEEFKRISNVEVAHTAWNILQTVREGTKAIKINKLQQLTSKFESIRISDDKSECDEDGNFIAFTATTVVNENIFAEENPSDGELSEDADL